GARGVEQEIAGRARNRERAGCGGVAAHDPDDNGRLAAVQKVLLHREAHRTQVPEPAKEAIELAKAVNLGRRLDGPLARSTDKGRGRGRDSGDGPDSAGELLDVHAWIGHSHHWRVSSWARSVSYLGGRVPLLVGDGGLGT